MSAPGYRGARTVAHATGASGLRGILRSMNVAERLLQDLADARRRGEQFETAWPRAVKHAIAGQRADERTAWRTALHATHGVWASAWERQPATRAQRAALAVAPDPEREPLAA